MDQCLATQSLTMNGWQGAASRQDALHHGPHNAGKHFLGEPFDNPCTHGQLATLHHLVREDLHNGRQQSGFRPQHLHSTTVSIPVPITFMSHFLTIQPLT
jgi:hypothetical protein